MNRKILIVDDQEENLYLLQAMLGSNGYTLVQARNGAEALDLARKNKPDIIISDILMPVMDGFSLCRECKKDPELKHVPLVFYTATYTDDRDRAFALSLGAARFIVKPEEPDVFIKTIREVLQDGGHDGVVSETPPEEHDYLKQYNETLIRKLEECSESLAKANALLKTQIADLKVVQVALQESEQRHRMLFENSMDAIMLTIPDGGILDANPAACRMLGRTVDEIRNLSRKGLLYLSDPQLGPALEERERTGAFHGELTFLRSDGTRFPAEISSVIFKTPSGEERTCLVIRDVTERKHVEEALQTQLEELRRWHKAMLGREGRNLELKSEVNELLAKMGLPKKYGITEGEG